MHPGYSGIDKQTIMLEIQFDPPFLQRRGANDGFFGKPGDHQEFLGELQIIDVKIQKYSVFDLYEMQSSRAPAGNAATVRSGRKPV